MLTNARIVLNALREAMDAAVSSASAGRVNCQRAVPRIDGTLYFDFLAPGGALRLNWLDPGEGNGHHLAFSAGTDPKEPGRSRLLRAVVETFERILENEEFALLRYRNRGRRRVHFDAGLVDALLGDCLVAGETSWYSYLYRGSQPERPGRIRISFQNARGPVGFAISPVGTAPELGRLVFQNRVLVASLEEDCREPKQRAQVVHQVERFLGFLFNRAIPPGMRLDPESMALALGDDRGAPISTSRWGNPRQWYQFFSDFEIERSSLCSFRFVDPISWVTHGEAECRWIEPELVPRAVSYINPPWESEPPAGSPGSMSIFTTLTEQDVVMGGTEKLQAALQQATSNPGARFVCLNNTCLPKIIGDDVASCVDRINRRGSVPILTLNTDLDSPDSSFHDLVRQAREKGSGEPEVVERRGLNLVGYPANRARRELIDLLGQMGIPVNMCLLPDIGIDLLSDYLRGRASVVYPHASWEKLADKILSDLEVPCRVLDAPYGLERSLGWLRAVADIMGRQDKLELFERERLEQYRDLWEAQRRQASGHSLAFVVDPDGRERLENASRLYGFEILSLIREMGFATRVFTLGESFSNRRELDQLLRRGDFQAVYSEVFFDKRITRAGKAQFNLSMLEMGFEGALRSIRRLINVCRFPFYRRYAGYLGGRR